MREKYDFPEAEKDIWSRIAKLQAWEQRMRTEVVKAELGKMPEKYRVRYLLRWARRSVLQDGNLLQSVAKGVYETYQEQFGWPKEPPAVQVALAWPSLGLSGWKPLVVPLNVPQPKNGTSDASVPSFIADPLLDLRNLQVLRELLSEGKLDAQVCNTALSMQNDLKSWLGVEASGEYAVPAFPDAGQGVGVRQVQGEAQPGPPEPMSGGVDTDVMMFGANVNEVMPEGLEDPLHGAGSEAALVAYDFWPESVDAFAPDAYGYGGYAHAEGAWQAQPPGVDALPQWMTETPIAATASAQAGYEVADSSWDDVYGAGADRSAASPQSNTPVSPSLFLQATEYLLAESPADWSAGTQGNDEPVARRVSATTPPRPSQKR
ncbi:hypothetical protein [Streptomyces sp. NPDC006012]|uniref:hypothetical protein n=1 Tax=Streptomyces sp. NPDC006012 TaxID=3364739 RepID=UPI0036A5AA80